MTRVFRRGELPVAVLHVLAATGPGNGYSIMSGLAERVGGGWRPSPGAAYPTLLALEDSGHIVGTDNGSSRRYALTDAGRRAAAETPDLLDTVAERAATRPPRRTLGTVLDAFAAEAPGRHRPVGEDRAGALHALLDDTQRRIDTLLNERNDPHG